MKGKSRIRLVEEQVARIEQVLTNEIMHRLSWHDKLIYTVLGMLCLILAALMVEILR